MSKARIIADYAGTGATTDLATQAELDTVSTVASAALPKAGGAMTGAITTNSTFDGVDVATLTSGVLKENLLTNSGFDVWSNSTLVDVGSNLITSWSNGYHPFETFDPSGANFTQLENTTGWGGAYQAVSLTVGKLYRLKMTATVTSGGLPEMGFTSHYQGNDFGPRQQLVAGANELVFKAVADDDYVYLQQWTGVAGDFALSSVSLYEVTPGCVDANALAFDGWDKDDTLDIWREHDGSNTKEGSFYATKMTSPSGTLGVGWPHASLWTNASHYTRFQGRTVTFGMWVKSSDSSSARLWIYDGSSSYSDYHTGGGGWEWLEKTITFGTTITDCRFVIQINAGTAYISQPMLVFGSSIGSGNYTRPKGEVVWLEYYERLNIATAPVASDDKILDLEVLSSGKIPKGVKAVYFKSQIQDSSVTSNNGITYAKDSTGQHNSMSHFPQVSAMRSLVSGWVACDVNGDIYQTVSNSTGTLSSHYIDVMGVELH